jgi:hypothetical protein
MALPRLIAVREDKDKNDGTTFLCAFRGGAAEAMEGQDGAETVGIYKLVSKRRLIRVIQEVR